MGSSCSNAAPVSATSSYSDPAPAPVDAKSASPTESATDVNHANLTTAAKDLPLRSAANLQGQSLDLEDGGGLGVESSGAPLQEPDEHLVSGPGPDSETGESAAANGTGVKPEGAPAAAGGCDGTNGLGVGFSGRGDENMSLDSENGVQAATGSDPTSVRGGAATEMTGGGNARTGDCGHAGLKALPETGFKDDGSCDSGLEDDDVEAITAAGMDDGSSGSGREDDGHSASGVVSRSGVTLIRVGNRQTRASQLVVEAKGPLQVHAFSSLAPRRQELVVEHKMSGIGELCITKPAPEFEANSVVDGGFKMVKLSDYRGKYLVIFFYPLDFTFVCPTEIISFSDRVEEFRSIGCEILACSTDSVYSHLAWVNTPRKQGGLGPMKIPLLADKTMEISRKYGCLKEDEGVAFRGLFIIDGKGILRQITINDLPVGRSVDETLRLVQAFQFTDEHGEVCPAGWRPGKETMKPDPKGSKDYFSKAN